VDLEIKKNLNAGVRGDLLTGCATFEGIFLGTSLLLTQFVPLDFVLHEMHARFGL